MPVYNLLEYSDNYSMTSGSLWKYYRTKQMIFGNCRLRKNKTATSKLLDLEHKTKIT